ncbi:MAG: response regulator [Alphaproteobacteria bacterium]|nr:response regulator [Alphaproteobacteria bacterium]
MPTAAKLTVVVVDDQLTMRSLVRASLQQIGVNDVREYPGGAEALENLKFRPANVVISDYNMPDMNGMEFLKALRANPQYKSTAFILLTGRADRDLVVEAVKAGANNYLVKPFTAATLKQKIEQVVGALA